VLIWHYVHGLIYAQPASLLAYIVKAMGLTWSGVDLFFVLSGFLIGGLLLDNRETVNYFKVFYVRRICRIFPLYFACLLLFYILIFMLGSAPPFDWTFARAMPAWSYLTFTQNISMARYGTFGAGALGITWSLAVEEQYYLICPLAVRLLSSRRLLLTLIIIIITTPLVRVAFFYIGPGEGFSAGILLPCRIDALLLGCLCAYLIRQKKGREFIASHVKELYAGLAILLLIAAVLLVKGQSISAHMTFYGYTLLALLYSCFLLIAITEKRGVVSFITRNYLLRKLGLLAYGIYMFHQGILGLFHALMLKQAPQIRTHMDVAVTLFALAATIATAYASWVFFEKRFVALGHSFKYARRQSASPPPSNSLQPTARQV
jgi:peptidoglycan/LPS O-acetylase OafA/YrhL